MGKVRTGSQSRSTGLSVGRTTALKHPWGLAASGSWRGTALATRNTGCLEPTWSSGSRRRPPSSPARRARRQGRWCLVRRTSDLTHGWGGKHPLDVPVFVVTRLGPTRMGLRRIAVHVRHRRPRRRPRASESGHAATRTSAWAPRASCSSASEGDSSTRSTWTWCPSCSGAASACSTPRHRADRPGAHEGDRGCWGDASCASSSELRPISSPCGPRSLASSAGEAAPPSSSVACATTQTKEAIECPRVRDSAPQRGRLARWWICAASWTVP